MSFVIGSLVRQPELPGWDCSWRCRRTELQVITLHPPRPSGRHPHRPLTFFPDSFQVQNGDQGHGIWEGKQSRHKKRGRRWGRPLQNHCDGTLAGRTRKGKGGWCMPPLLNWPPKAGISVEDEFRPPREANLLSCVYREQAVCQRRQRQALE